MKYFHHLIKHPSPTLPSKEGSLIGTKSKSSLFEEGVGGDVLTKLFKVTNREDVQNFNPHLTPNPHNIFYF